MQGVLLVDKPAGWTSFDVVNYARKIVATAEGKKPRQVKVGHSGTLDPFATGLLVLLIGKEYTRRASEFSKLDKTYEVTMRLGQTSTTGDPEGDIKPCARTDPVRRPRLSEVEEAMQKFVGEIEQLPPAYSAIKVNGQRAYELARAGKQPRLKARPIAIKRLQMTDYNYPDIKLVADVSSGTYIRVLVEDLGKALQTCAFTVALRRVKVGKLSLRKATLVAGLTRERLEQALQQL